jgi:exopolysaccharide production protein ExoZ
MLNSLQACRALAAILIVVCHTNDGIFGLPKYFGAKPFGTFFDFAPAAIDFFFVLSGFIIMYVHTADIGKPRAFAGYLWKRYSRVYLFYWVVLAAVLPVFFLAPQLGGGYERDPDVIVRSILLLPHPQNQMIVSVAWTLVFEMLFYLLFGVLVLDKRLGVAIFIVWTAGILAYPSIEAFRWSFVCNNMHLRFVAGVCVCVIFQNYRIPAPRLVAASGVALFLTLGMVEVFHGLSSWIYIAGYTLSSALIIAGLGESDRSGLTQAPKWLVSLGNATYSIYLVHFLALSVIAKLCKASQLDQYVPHIPLFFLHVAGAVGVGCMCHHWIEVPLYNWSKQFFRGVNPPPVLATEAAEVDVRKAA